MQAGHIAVEPLIDGMSTTLWLDTGAQLTTLTFAAAQRLSLELHRMPGYLEGVGGRRQSYSFVARSLQLGRLQGVRFRLTAADMRLSEGGDAVDGLLGMDLLSAYDVDIDVQGGQIRLFKSQQACAGPQAFLDGTLYVVPLVRSRNVFDRRRHLQVRIAGRMLTAMLDTGAPSSLLFRDSARRIGIDTATLAADRHFRAGGVGPGAPMAATHVLTPIAIGELTVSHLPVAVVDQPAPPDADMLLGMDFMSRVHTWFSFSTGNLVLEYPPRPSPVLPAR